MDCVFLFKFLSQTCEFLVLGCFKQLFNLICLFLFINLGFKVFYFGFRFTGLFDVLFDVSRKPIKKTGACLVKKPEFKLKKSISVLNGGFDDNIDGKKDGEFCNVLGKNGTCSLETVKKSEPKLEKRNIVSFGDNSDDKNNDILKKTGSCSLETVKKSEPKLEKRNIVSFGDNSDDKNNDILKKTGSCSLETVKKSEPKLEKRNIVSFGDNSDDKNNDILKKTGSCSLETVKKSEPKLKNMDSVKNGGFGDSSDDIKDGELSNMLKKSGPCLVKKLELKLKQLDIVSNMGFGDDSDDKKDGELCNVDEVFDVLLLRKMVKKERMKAKAAHKELEKERVAAATATDETMAMILRVQKEKSLVEMEFNQYRRLVEEKQIHDQEVIESLRWMVMKHESERGSLEDQLRLYKRRLKYMSKDDDRYIWEENKENDGRVRFFDSGNVEGSPWHGLISSLDFDLTTP